MALSVLPSQSAEALAVAGGGQTFDAPDVAAWQRPTDWLPMPSIASTDAKFVGLLAVTDTDTNFVALNAAGAYTVDWGDGSATENKATGVQANHQYTYSSISSATDCSRGYRQVLVTVTPQAGQSLTTINLRVRHSQVGLNAYDSRWLDVQIAGPALTTITIGANTETVRLNWLERARVLSSAVTTWADQFRNCTNLQEVEIASSATVTSATNMFSLCQMLRRAPRLNMSAVTDATGMFQGCTSLEVVPHYDTSSLQNLTSMFNGCYKLKTVPLFNLAAATNMTSTFAFCYGLVEVPKFDTSAVQTMNSTFFGCSALETVPLFNTSAVTEMSGLFNQSGVSTIPALDTSNVWQMTSLFNATNNLQTIPALNTSSATAMSTMFSTCRSLVSIPTLNAAAVTSAPTSMFTTCASLSSAVLTGMRFGVSYQGAQLSATSLEAIMDALGAAYGSQTLTITSNWGAPSQVSLSGTTTSGSTTVTMASTGGLSAGMEITGTGISDAVSATVQDSGDTFTRTAHGLSDGDRIGVLTLNGAGGGIALNTPYYVVNKTANTFQVADTAGGSAKTITATPKFTAVTSGFSDTDANNYTTASVTLTTGRLYLLSVENSHGTSATAISSVTGGAGVPTFTSRVTSNLGTSATLNRVSIWSAVPSSDYTGTLTINFGGTTQTGACWSLVEVVNVDTATNNGIVASNSAKGSGTTPSVTAAALTTSTNALFGAIGSLATSGAPIGRYTEVHDVAATTPVQSLQTLYQSAVSETLDRTISETTTSANFGACCVEIKAGTATADGAATINYGTTISSIVANTSVTLSVPASASGTITTTSAVLKRSKARIRGFTVSG